MTARELAAYAKGVCDRAAEERMLALWTAWHVAAFTRAKKLPDPDKLMRKVARRRRTAMTTQQMVSQAERMLAMFGGVDLREKKD